jgi:hypothetical protein
VRVVTAILIGVLTSLLVSAAFAGSRVAVQPFGGPETEPLRQQVARIVGKHGFRVLTNLAPVSGTAQYPGLAKQKRLSAFVVADVSEHGKHIHVSFVVWQGINGSVVGRWEVSVPKNKIAQKLAKEFWKRLGSAIEQALAPPSDELPPAPTMRINAGTPVADPPDPTFPLSRR